MITRILAPASLDIGRKSRLCRSAVLLVLYLLTGMVCRVQGQGLQLPGRDLVSFTPEPTDEVLFNSGMGVYLQYPPLDSRSDEWFMQIADIAYYRLHWCDVNPEEGVYTFDEWFEPRLDFWVKQHGKRLAFGVMSQSMHGHAKYVTPKWVFDRGVPGVAHTSKYGDEQINPVFWDDRYLDLLCEFIAKLGEYLDGKEGLEFVDMRGIGEWGEMHLARWTPEQLDKTGFTQARYIMAYRRMIDAFAEAFPKTRVFLNVGGPKHHSINDYAALRGMHFRQDGLKPGGASYNCGEWLFKPYSRRGVSGNFEFHAGYQSALQRGWSPKETIDAALATPISYLNTGSWLGGGGLRTAPEEAKDWLTVVARRLGYRFVLTRLELPEKFHLNAQCRARIPLGSTWCNEGLAPCYESFAIEWSLHAADGSLVAGELTFPKTPTTAWWPGEELGSESALLRLPAGVPAGRYHLKVAMLLPETGRRVNLPIAGRDEQGRYALTEIEGVEGGVLGGSVYREDFDSDMGSWSGTSGMTTVVGPGQGRAGSGALLVSGTQERGWNYASAALAVPLIPAARYRLTAWLLVDQLEPTGKPPYIKLGANDADGKWIDNFSSDTYDLSRLGTWQKLTAVVETPLNAAVGVVAIEKGANTLSITAEIRLDDMDLELLEAP